MEPVNPLTLPPWAQIQWELDRWPEQERLVRLAYAEQKAQERQDKELLSAIAAWRLRQQL